MVRRGVGGADEDDALGLGGLSLDGGAAGVGVDGDGDGGDALATCCVGFCSASG